MDYLLWITCHLPLFIVIFITCHLSFFFDKIVAKNFLREIAHRRKSLISIFKGFFASIGKMFFFGGGDWVLGYNSMEWGDFPDISEFPKIPSLKSFDNSWGNSNIPFLLLIITHRFTCGEKKFGKTSKSIKILWPWLQLILLY